SVPMLIISSRISTCVKPASTATAAPVISCRRTGVFRVSDVTLSQRGSRPSRLIASSTRDNPISSTTITVVRPTRIPIEITCAAHPAPTATNAVASDGFSASASRVYGTMPVSANATPMYSRVTSARPPKMPSGSVRCGSFTSSADVATTSKPMNAKNTSAAPESTPAIPYFAGAAPVAHDSSDCDQASALPPSVRMAGGTNGVRLSTLKYVSPTTITNSTMPTLITVNTLLTRADILVPMISNAVNTATMNRGPQSTPMPATSIVVGMCTSKSWNTIAR